MNFVSEMPLPSMYILFWLIAMIVFIVGEMITVGLTCIWFAAGALVALIIAAFGGGIVFQIVAFLLVSGILLWMTRPWAKRFINSKVQKTNVERVVGERACVTERVSNLDQTGRAVVLGQDWSIRTEDDNEIIEPGTMIEVVGVSGVKRIVKNVEKIKKED